MKVLVTGADGLLGTYIVEALLARGEAVTVLDLNEPRPRADSARVGSVIVDVADEVAVRRALARASAERGPVDGVVACHGIRGQFVPALDLDLDAMRRLLDIHVLGTLIVAREVVRAAGDVPPSIVAVSSTTAYGGWVNQSDYGVAKAAIRQLVENLAVEWAPLGVRVNAVAPGHTLTPMVRDLVDHGYSLDDAILRTPLGRLATPEQQAAEIVHLLRDATHVTGQCLPVDGGLVVVGR